ncbi:MAG TPA: pectinesterase family protein [Candidatus Sulfopaludibacter sp.]|nr:pectinesterase family protein [Candidatus Sulfopaludibacter sp.]
MKSYYRIAFLLAPACTAAAQPRTCAVLAARPASAGADTARIQAALNLCEPGGAVVLRRLGNNARFDSAPLILPRGVTLFIDQGVTLYASRNPRDYDLAPGSCGAPPAGKAASCKPFIFSYQAAFSGVSGPGTIDGQADAWKNAPRGAAIPDLVSSYESQNFHIEGVTLRNAAGVHAAIYKTTSLSVSDVKVDSDTGDGLLLSNTTGGVVADVWIRVPGDAIALKASMLGPTNGIYFPFPHVFGGRGISVGDETYGPVSNITVDGLAMDGAAPGFAVKGRARELRVRSGCIASDINATGWELQGVTAGGCTNPPFTSAPKSSLTAEIAALPAPGKARLMVVAQDGSAPFTSIQAAINALPATGGEIVVKPGVYREVVTIRKPHVHLQGADSDPAKTVIVFNHGPSYAGTFASGTLYVEADDVTLDHLTIANDLGPGRGQGVALAVTADRAIFRHLRIRGAQDTLFAASRYCYGDYGPCVAARQYFEDCYIEGNTDFIFGDALAVFERCELHGIEHGNVMYTAQSRHTAGQRDSAYVFAHCRLTGEARPGGVISLGRPWRPYATVVFLHTEIEAPAIPAGWTEWPRFGKPSLPTTFYAEYDSTGPGANPKARNPYSKQLTEAEAEQWSPRKVLGGWEPGR